MKISTENKWHKVSNFIDYILEHFDKKGKKYQLKLKAEDMYDKKLINNRIHSLHNKLLVGYEDGFEILELNLIEDFNSFKQEITDFVSDSALLDKLTEKIFKKAIEFDLEFIKDEKFAELSFKFINLNKI